MDNLIQNQPKKQLTQREVLEYKLQHTTDMIERILLTRMLRGSK